MPTIAQQLTQLENDRSDLVDNLETKGITGLSGDETFTELVPEVLNISGGGGSASDYITYPNITENTSEANYTPNNATMQLGKDSTSIPIKISSSVTSLEYAFTHFPFSIDFSDWNNIDCRNVTSIRLFMSYVTAPEIIDLGNCDFKNVTNVDHAFSGCTTEVIDLEGSFGGNNSSITTLSNMFYNYQGKKVTFGEDQICHRDSITSVYYMFSGCSYLEEVNMSGFYSENLTNCEGWFRGCVSLKKIDLRNCEFLNITNKNQMLQSVPTNCEIIVRDEEQEEWFNNNFPNYTNITIAEEE